MLYIRKCLFIISVIGCLFLFTINTKEESDSEISCRFFDFQISFPSIIGQRKKEEDILFVVHIPRIDLEKNVYTIDSSKNDVDYNVQILEGSDVDNNFLFLAAHSGSGLASYFNRLVELEVGDIVWIDKGDKREYFVVETLFYIPKDGYLEYSPNENYGVLYLITCSLEYIDMQLVIKATFVQ